VSVCISSPLLCSIYWRKKTGGPSLRLQAFLPSPPKNDKDPPLFSPPERRSEFPFFGAHPALRFLPIVHCDTRVWFPLSLSSGSIPPNVVCGLAMWGFCLFFPWFQTGVPLFFPPSPFGMVQKMFWSFFFLPSLWKCLVIFYFSDKWRSFSP